LEQCSRSRRHEKSLKDARSNRIWGVLRNMDMSSGKEWVIREFYVLTSVWDKWRKEEKETPL
jgi:hypothetical protein